MLLKNGWIVDGTGQATYTGSIYVEKDQIVSIFRGEVPQGEYGEVLDCTGKWITPGFIDAHSHSDFFVTKPDSLFYFEPFLKQGVTTMIAGNCGFSTAGYRQKTIHQDEIGGGLFTNDGLDHSDFASWATKVDGHMPVNMLSLIGHGTIRIGINGKDASPLSEEQLQEMEKTLENALDQGAAGISFGLMYEPGQFAPYEELKRVAMIAKNKGKIATFHARAYSKVSTSYNPPVGGRAHNLRAIDEVVKLAKETGVKTELSHLIFVGENSWSTVDESLSILEETKNQGIDIGFDTYPMEFGASVITVILPTWYLSLPAKKRKGWWTQIRLAFEIFLARKALGFGFEDILIANTFGKHPEWEGKRVSDLSKEWKQSNLKTYLQLVDETEGKINVLMYRYQNPEIIERLRQHPQSLYMSDAWMEKEASVQNYACYYAFTKFLVLARDHQTSIEQAIHKMTGATAARFGIEKRGVLQEGAFADLNVLDLNTLSYLENQGVSPKGMEYTINNGVILVKKGVLQKKAAQSAGRLIKM